MEARLQPRSTGRGMILGFLSPTVLLLLFMLFRENADEELLIALGLLLIL